MILYYIEMVNKPTRGANGMYSVKGNSFKELFGSRHQVMNGTAFKTTGGLTKKDLMYNKWGRIVSRSKYITAKKEKRLEKHGFFATKGKFGYTKKAGRGGSKMFHMRKGGEGSNTEEKPAEPQHEAMPEPEKLSTMSEPESTPTLEASMPPTAPMVMSPEEEKSENMASQVIPEKTSTMGGRSRRSHSHRSHHRSHSFRSHSHRSHH
jgi:hypothetical protein